MGLAGFAHSAHMLHVLRAWLFVSCYSGGYERGYGGDRGYGGGYDRGGYGG